MQVSTVWIATAKHERAIGNGGEMAMGGAKASEEGFPGALEAASASRFP